MSHIAKIKTEIKDLEAVRLACDELGLTFLENQKTCAFWPVERKPQQHPCDHAIRLPAGHFAMELGLVKTETGYDLVGDELLHIDEKHTGKYGRTGKEWCKNIFGTEVNPLGSNLGRFIRSYTANKVEIEAAKRGWLVSRSVVAGTNEIKMTLSGM